MWDVSVESDRQMLGINRRLGLVRFYNWFGRGKIRGGSRFGKRKYDLYKYLSVLPLLNNLYPLTYIAVQLTIY